MRGRDDRSEGLFSYIRLEERVPADHPLRALCGLADEALADLSERFEALCSGVGRPSIAPEMLLRATLLQAFSSVRLERRLMEQIDYNLLFRWFVGLPIDACVWHPTVFTHNRDRLMAADVAQEFLAALMRLPKMKRLLSSEHFSVDGTSIDALGQHEEFPSQGRVGRAARSRAQRGAGLPKGEALQETHASATDPDSRLYRKADGRESRLCFMGPCANGEPTRAGDRGHAHARHGHGRTGGCYHHAGSA